MDTDNITDTLSAGYLLVDITLRRFSGYKKDKRASEDVTASAGAQHNAAKVVKDLLAGARAELKEVASTQDAIRSFLYTHTLPWNAASDGIKTGARLLPAAKSFDFLRDYKQLTVVYQTALADFLSVYDARRQQAMQNLGTLANSNDYPTREEIAGAFGASIDLSPVPAPSDFSRLALPVEMVESLGGRIARQQNKALENAMRDLAERIVEELKRMTRQLNKVARGEKTRVYASLLGNLSGLVDLLRASNFTNDAKLAELADRLAECSQHDIKAVKNNVSIASSLADKAEAISLDIENDLYF